MSTLSQIYGTVPQVCLIDEDGVYLRDKKISLSNGENNGYIRRDGPRQLTRIGGCQGDFTSELPLKFVGVVINGDVDKVEQATVAALLSDTTNITEVEVDKSLIASSENIDLEDLTKFDGTVMIMVSYTDTSHYEADPRCDYDLC